MSSQQHDSAADAVAMKRHPFIRALIALAVIVAAFLVGRGFAYHDVVTRDATIRQLQKDGQQFETTINQQNNDLLALRSQVAELNAKLEAIMPSRNTYNIDPNHAMIVADGRLTVGWVGLPTVDAITININGTPQPVAVGDIIRVSPDAATACELRLQSFDITRARFTASCTAKSQ
jgi:hypothetical protein